MNADSFHSQYSPSHKNLTPLDETILAWHKKTRDQQDAAFQTAMKETLENRLLASAPYFVGLVFSAAEDGSLFFDPSRELIERAKVFTMLNPYLSIEEKEERWKRAEHMLRLNEEHKYFMSILTEYWQNHGLTPDEAVRDPEVVGRAIPLAYGSLEKYAQISLNGFDDVEQGLRELHEFGSEEIIKGFRSLKDEAKEYLSKKILPILTAENSPLSRESIESLLLLGMVGKQVFEGVIAPRSGFLTERFIEDVLTFSEAFVRAWRGEVKREIEAYRRVLQGGK